MRRFFPDLAFMALRLCNPRVRLHKYPFISIVYHNLTLHIIMSAVNSKGKLKMTEIDVQFQSLSIVFVCAVKHEAVRNGLKRRVFTSI